LVDEPLETDAQRAGEEGGGERETRLERELVRAGRDDEARLDECWCGDDDARGDIVRPAAFSHSLSPILRVR
jgi:hypothetical protein